MRHTYVHTTYKSELLFLATYSCAYCGTENGDRNSLRLKGDMPGKVVRDPHTGSLRSLTAAQYFSEQLQRIESGDVRSIRLNARCSKCGKRPAWAHYPRKTWHIVSLVFGIIAALFAWNALRAGLTGTAGIHWPVFAASALLAVILLFLSLPLYFIRRKARDKKIAALTPEQMPKILLLPKVQ